MQHLLAQQESLRGLFNDVLAALHLNLKDTFLSFRLTEEYHDWLKNKQLEAATALEDVAIKRE